MSSNKKKRLIVFSGAGVSAESGLKTFRDSDGLWENYNVEEIATIEAWNRNPQLVLDFYNARRAQALTAQPNSARLAIAALEQNFDVTVITQNIDNLHERAGSTDVLHLHGMIDIAKSEKTGKQVQLNGKEIKIGDFCEDGFQLRPDIVWFGEEVPNMEIAADICAEADFLIVVGTSLNVYPAAGLIHCVPDRCKKFIVDPFVPRVSNVTNYTVINKKATEGITQVARLLKSM